jgi:amidase
MYRDLIQPSAIVEHIPGRGDLGTTFGGREPILTIAPRSLLRTWTQDCFGGHVMTVNDLPSLVCGPDDLSPVTGPFFVDGAEPGDTIAVHVLDLVPARRWGVSATSPSFRGSASGDVAPVLTVPLPERVWIYRIDPASGTTGYRATASDHAIDLTLDPVIGTIGVAPAGGAVIPSTINGPHGGHLDIPLLRTGTTVYFPVNEPGALLSVGSCHAHQGEGQACGTGIECAMDVSLTVDLIKGVQLPCLRLQTSTCLGSIGCARPLEEAYRIAHTDLTCWVSELTGLTALDAHQLLCLAGETRIGSVCEHDFSVVTTVSIRHLQRLRADPVLEGVHDRLTASADDDQ